ncbi:MAG TPA: carboxypeptidase-like regulatory domain-containing protein [Vicinamibacterales bacterium]|nr:carboxypeptidase-like regulatory domain-containing protein [Vicinamibacterales bacterium]
MFRHLVIAFIIVICAPALAFAQSGIAGVVRDSSGAVLPGVAVEATSPALIEKVRATVTDGSGAYILNDLRPGQYSVTFTLPGFTTVVRNGIDLPAFFTATVSVQLSVGELQETVTVTGEAPAVDVRSASTDAVLKTDLLESIPAVRSPQGYVALTPGMTAAGITSVGGGREEMDTATNGSHIWESVFQIDGISTSSVQAPGGGNNTFRISQNYVAEINVRTAGGSADQQHGGTVTNIIPRQGGNVFSGIFYSELTNDDLQGSNLTDDLRAQGFTDSSLTKNVKVWEVSPSLGGPIVRDRLWFFASYRNAGTIQTRAGIYENLTPLGWTYTPDLSNPAVIKITDTSNAARLTFQATPRNQFMFFADYQPHIVHQRNYQFVASPEATTYTPFLPNALKTLTWKSPASSRLLLEGFLSHHRVNIDLRRPDGIGYTEVSAFEQTTGMMFRSASSLLAGASNYGPFDNKTWRYGGSASYVTGSHSAKVGIQVMQGNERFASAANRNMAFTLRNGLPVSIRQYVDPLEWQNDIRPEIGLYAQDQWTRGRLTLSGGLRWDYLQIGYPENDLAAGDFVPARHYDAVPDAVIWKDLNPRMAAAWDLTGDGKTALTVSVNRYIGLQGAGLGGINNNNPAVRSVQFANRTWTDTDADFEPDCDLRNFLQNGECGQISNLFFGQDNPNATIYDPELLRGKRNYNWETSAVVQREILPRSSVTVGYYRRQFGNFTVNDNIAVGPENYSPYCITAPVDPRLPGGGGTQECGMYDIAPVLFGVGRVIVRSNEPYGKQEQVYDGVNLTQSTRFSNGSTVQGGISWGRTRTNNCFTVDSPEQLRFCDVNPPMLATASLVGFHPLPYGFVASATYRDYPGAMITAAYQAPNSIIAPSLGRNLAAGPNATATVQLVEPGTMYAPRQRALDLRFSKRIQVGKTRISGNLDVFNVFNATSIVTLNTTYGPAWQRPTLLQGARFLKISGQFDF